MSFRPPDLRHVPLPILEKNDRWVAVDKPSGLLSVPAKDPSITDNVRARIAELFPDATGSLTIHRLDMETSGVLLLALDPTAHRDLSIQFQERIVTKTYVAVVEGQVANDAGTIELPIRLDVERRPFQIVDYQHGKYAYTRWQVIERRPLCTRILLLPETGRTHQLRVHCAHAEGLGHPILGDRLYGSPHTAKRLMLHARSLRFEDPTTNLAVSIDAPIPF